VTEAEWLAATDPGPMLEFLRGRTSERKLRLLACACCRRIWHLLTHAVCREAIETAERYSDGLATAEELWSAHDDAQRLWILGGRDEDYATHACVYAASPEAYDCNRLRPGVNAVWVVECIRQAATSNNDRMAPVLSDLVRDVVDDPFRPPPAVAPGWHAWGDGALPKLARAAYEERHLPEGTLNPGRLRILADALEDAGCADSRLLGHLRAPGVHVRGCRAVDLILGKS
jgi:hypothetical protein